MPRQSHWQWRLFMRLKEQFEYQQKLFADWQRLETIVESQKRKLDLQVEVPRPSKKICHPQPSKATYCISARTSNNVGGIRFYVEMGDGTCISRKIVLNAPPGTRVVNVDGFRINFLYRRMGHETNVMRWLKQLYAKHGTLLFVVSMMTRAGISFYLKNGFSWADTKDLHCNLWASNSICIISLYTLHSFMYSSLLQVLLALNLMSQQANSRQAATRNNHQVF